MILDGILNKIGFSEEMQEECNAYIAQAGNCINEIAESFMKGDKDIKTAIAELDSLDMNGINNYTKHLLFFLFCTGPLYDQYLEKGYSEEMFIDTMKDITCKVQECYYTDEVMGINCADWFSGYFKMTRFGFGRMQFDITTHPCEAVEVGGYTVNEGDFIVKGHVPSMGPLLHEDCMKSYKAVYEFVKDKLNGKPLPIEFWSWILFPNYRDFYGENSNLARFIADYKVFGHYETDIFYDAWRFFGKDAGKEKLPTKTTLQKKFAEYIAPGKTYGYGKGIFLFDGENIIK